MAGWTLTKGLQNLRGQLNERWPNRDHASDGTIGDLTHQAEVSGHNPDDTRGSRPAWAGDPDSIPEVRAFDCDSDFREAGVTAQMVVDHIRQLPGVSSVIRYMIFNRKMYHSRNGFIPSVYSGASAHTEHIHFEGAWSQAADNDTTFDYRLEEVGDMPLTVADANLLINQMGARLRAGDPNDDFVKYVRAAAWQYTGGGLKGAGSTLDALSDSQLVQSQLNDLATSLMALRVQVTKLAAGTPADPS